MQEILTLIHNNGDPTLSRLAPSWERVPWIEQNTAATFLANRPSPRLISSHLPPTIFPESFFTSQAKVILWVGVCVKGRMAQLACSGGWVSVCTWDWVHAKPVLLL